MNLDLTEQFYGAGWKKIRFNATGRCRIAYVLEVKVDITA